MEVTHEKYPSGNHKNIHLLPCQGLSHVWRDGQSVQMRMSASWTSNDVTETMMIVMMDQMSLTAVSQDFQSSYFSFTFFNFPDF
jgi:hypothetical protein